MIGECLRRRGKDRLGNPALDLLVTERVDSEFQHELQRRLGQIAGQGQLSSGELERLRDVALQIYFNNVTVALVSEYSHLEAEARARIPADADDWPTLALALALDCGVWTGDRDFFGCGLPVWRTDVLYAALGRPPS